MMIPCRDRGSFVHPADTAQQALIDIANRMQDKKDEAADAARVHAGETLAQFREGTNLLVDINHADARASLP